MTTPISEPTHFENLVELTAQARQLLDSGKTAHGRRLLEQVLLVDPDFAPARQLLIKHNLAPAWKLREWQEQDQYLYFVDDNIHEYHGPAAAQRLAEKNDARFLTVGGILQVDDARWQEAQRYEKKTWMEQNLDASDDRNEFHKQQFDNYAAIAGRAFPRIIELGCGPFTNLRLILPLINNVQHVDLLDPLIQSYLTHPHCTYRDRKLAGVPIQPIVSPIEGHTATQPYDMVVMVNVLEHCYDIPRIFANVLNWLKPSGIFVFADVATTAEALRATKTYDAGHPIRIVDDYLLATLHHHFAPLHHNTFRDVTHLQHRDICHYYIGRKL